MANEVIRELQQSPLPDMVAQLGISIAEAQFVMDRHSVRSFQLMAEKDIEIGGEKVSMIELGLVPSFYHFGEASVEARIAFSMMKSREIGGEATVSAGYSIFSASVTATYSNKYSFSAEGSSAVSAKIVSVPPPAEVSDRIAALKQAQEKER